MKDKKGKSMIELPGYYAVNCSSAERKDKKDVTFKEVKNG